MSTLHEQIQCVAREIKLRENCYPKWVSTGRMKEEESKKQLQLMKDVIETLKEIKTTKDDIRREDYTLWPAT